MGSRKAMFVVSTLNALVLYTILFIAAPNIAILQANSEVIGVRTMFKVDLSDPLPTVEYENPVTDIDADAPRPASMSELLNDELQDFAEIEPILDEPTEMTHLASRVGSEDLERSHELEQDENVADRVDAKILEISREHARDDIEIARRLVQPSPQETLDTGDLTSISSSGGLFSEEANDATPIAKVLEQNVPVVLQEAPDDEEGFERPAFEANIAVLELPESDPPLLDVLDIDELLTRAPIREALREESAFEFMDDQLELDLTTYESSSSTEPAYFRLRIAPKDIGAMDVLPKDVTFVVDASKSILPRKLELTVRGISSCIEMLRPVDRFKIVAFRDSASTFSDTWTPATPGSKKLANQFLEGLQARGETDVYSAVMPVMEASPRKEAPEVIMVLSDGRPTSGFLQGREVINALTETNYHRKAVYAFGGGKTVNRYLLDLLAYRNKGESFVSGNYDTIDEDLPKFFSRLSDPILIDLNADYGQIAQDDVFPKEMPDFYNGRVVEVFGRYVPGQDKEFVVRINGVAGTKQKELLFRAEFDSATKGEEQISRQWAFQKVYHLIGEICRVGERPELLEEVSQLSTKYNIRTSYSR